MKYLNALNKEMERVDALAQTILKGHLIIEAALDNILAIILFHPEHLREARLTFNQKVHIARCYALRKNTNPVWNVILEINSLRNEIAHRLEGEKRRAKIARLREICRAEMDPAIDQVIDGATDEVVVTMSSAMCLGFLADFEHDTMSFTKLYQYSRYSDEPRQ
jgi:hypothetical protein